MGEDGWHINTRCVEKASMVDMQEGRERLGEVEMLSELASDV